MFFRSLTYYCAIFYFSTISLDKGSAQNPNQVVIHEKLADKSIKVTWCTITAEEQQKCRNLSMATERDHIRVAGVNFRVECIKAFDKDACMLLIDQEEATVTSVDAGELFIGGRYHSLIPIAQEVFQRGQKFYYAVAMMKRGSLPHVQSLHDVRGLQACFAGVETFAGWTLPIYTLMREGGMEIVDCNNQVKSATKYFAASCAVNCLTSKYNPIGDNSDKLCQLCTGQIPGGRCTNADPFAGYEGAFRCLVQKGDIAFVKHDTITDALNSGEYLSLSRDAFELLCKDGTRRSVDDYLNCNWGKVPTNALITTSAFKPDLRKRLQQFLKKVVELYGAKKNSYRNNYEETNSRQQQDKYEDRWRNRYKRQNYDRPTERNRYSNSNPYYDQQYNNNQRNPYKATNNSNRYEPLDPFAFDPYQLNPDQYGINIDPYQTQEERDRNRFPYTSTSTTTTTIIPSSFFDSVSNRNYSSTTSSNRSVLYETFNLFESSPRYGLHSNLLLSDTTMSVAYLNENQQTFTEFLGESLQVIMGVRDCPVHKMTLCVTSKMENDKCVKMKTALKAQLLKPSLECHLSHSQIGCMQAIQSGVADVTALDASDVYTAGTRYDLVPFISEVYNLNKPEYYVVAVVKESDSATELTYLRGKNTCHGGVYTAAGWVYPLAFLISNDWMRSYGCNSIRAAAEYFTKSCTPGASSTEYNTGVPYNSMCDLCHGTSMSNCRRDAAEDYYGHTGALRCLVEGGGDVAFVKHTTVAENADGRKREFWARDTRYNDFELLCANGARAEVKEYESCNLGKVSSNALVTRGGYAYNETNLNAFINLFLYSQTFYGRKTTDEFSFSMFMSAPPYSDLIFQDATTQLKVIPPEFRHYRKYVGEDFMRARRIVDCQASRATLTLHSNIHMQLIIISVSINLIVVASFMSV